MKFIQLTEVFQNGDNKKLFLNSAHIVSFKISDRGIDTHVTVTDGKFFFVKENVDAIARLCNTDDACAPALTIKFKEPV